MHVRLIPLRSDDYDRWMRGRRGRRLWLCLALLGLLLAGCGSRGPGDTDAFSTQRETLEHAWYQGREARDSLTKYGHDPTKEVNAQTCGAFFDATDASDVGRNDRYKALARGYFVKGCLNQPKDPPPTTKP
jgi:hypothetical protein